MIRGGITKRDEICAMLADIAEFMDADCMFSVTDTERFIAYIPGRTVDIRAKIGAQVPEQSPLAAAYKNKAIVTKVVPKEVWGVPFRSTATPIVDATGKVVGCVGIGMSIERENDLIETYRNFVKQLEGMSDINRSIVEGMQAVAARSNRFIESVNDANEKMKRAGALIAQIDSIASSTDMLSINASVEAAHAGAAGKGFAIVAGEMKSLSGKTKALAKDIHDLLGQIAESMEKLTGLTTENAKDVAEQIDMLKKMQHTVRALNETSGAYSKLIRQ